MKEIVYVVIVLTVCCCDSSSSLVGETIDLNLTTTNGGQMVGDLDEFNVSTLKSVTFSVKACDVVATLKLSKEYALNAQKYRVFLGKCNNKQSLIKNAVGEVVSIRNDSDVLSCDDFREFHIMWNDNMLSVFKMVNGIWYNHLCLHDTSPEIISYVSVRALNSVWKFYKQAQNLSLTLNDTDCPGYVDTPNPSVVCPVYTTTTEATTTVQQATTEVTTTSTVQQATTEVTTTSPVQPETTEVTTTSTVQPETTEVPSTAPTGHCYNSNNTSNAGNNTMCYYVCEKNYTATEIKALIEQLKKELTFDKKESTKYIRTKISAPDSRPSSAVIGFMGGAILIMLGVGLLILDLPNLILSLKMLKQMYCPCIKKNKANH